MGYRRLIAKYMQHVKTHSGNVWLGDTPSGDLSARDINELRSIWMTTEREIDIGSQGDFNQRALKICQQHSLSSTQLTQLLGWNQQVIEQWLLPVEHTEHRMMTKRDFEHLYNCVSSAFPDKLADA